MASSSVSVRVTQRPRDIINESFSSELREALSAFPNSVEVETRFTLYSYDPFRQDRGRSRQFSGLDQRTFYRLVNHYDNMLVRASLEIAQLVETREERMALPNDSSLRKTTMYRYRIEDNDYVYDANGEPIIEQLEYYDVKTVLNRFRGDRPNYNVRVSIATEQQVAKDQITTFQSFLTRIKRRRSYTLASGKYRLDLTEVTQAKKDGKEEKRYEVELELLNLANLSEGWDLDYEKQIKRVIGIMLETRFLYTVPEYKQIIFYYNTMMFASYKASLQYRNTLHAQDKGKKKFKRLDPWANPRELDPRQIYKPRNLHYKDMVFGGLVGNADTAYTITRKADGKHKLFVVYNYRIWLLQPRTEVSLVYYFRDHEQSPQLTEYFDMINGCIIEGELIPKDKRRNDAPNNYYFFLAFDCLAANDNDISIQQQPLVIIDGDNEASGSRLHKLVFLAEKIQTINDKTGNYMTFVRKKFTPFYSVNDLYAVFRRLDEQEESTPYETDGYIFTPIAMQYNSGHADLPLQKRVLTRYADICKWKPAQKEVDGIIKNMWTIDLMFLQTVQGYGLYTTRPVMGRARKGNENVLFEGTPQFPYQQRQDTIDEESLINVDGGIYDRGVGEFEWVATDDEGNGFLRMVRIRHDKMGKPNRHDFAEDTWELARNPIIKETMRGDDIKLMRRYHNRIKFTLFNQALNDMKCNNRTAKDEVTFLDIGSGRGGDSSKLARYSRGVFVEPYTPHLSELQRRTQSIFGNVEIVDANNWQQGVAEATRRGDRVVILHSGGENTQLITDVVYNFIGGPVDIVSMMLSLSFFWQSQQMYEQLIATIKSNIKDDGQFIYLTIDGDIVQQAFVPAFADGLTADSWSNDSLAAKISFNDSNKTVDIDLPGTIVGEQREWLVHLNDVAVSMRGTMIPDTRYRADQELFLSTTGKTLSTLYTYGRFLAV